VSRQHTAVFLCSCGDGISSVVDFKKVTDEIAGLPDVYSVQELKQACTEEGSRKMKAFVEQENIAHVVLAACRCCNLEQICFSCTDRRVMCQRNLLDNLPEVLI
jgi:heterodisulfide reductase subunit A-like polyferredoxin